MIKNRKCIHKINIVLVFIMLTIIVFTGCSLNEVENDYNENEIISGSALDNKNQIKDNKIDEEKSIASWVGKYSFSEKIPPDQNMFYSANIYNSEDEYFADIFIDGFQTVQRLKAYVVGDGEGIKLFFYKYLPDNITEPYDKDELLFELYRKNAKTLTKWGAIKSIDTSKQNTEGVYFVKEN